MAKFRISYLTFTYLLVITGFLGTKLFTISLGLFELSIFRVLIVIAALLYFNKRQSISNRYGSKFYNFLQIWLVYSLILLLFVIDFGNFLKYFIFLFSAFIVSYYSCCYLTKVEQYIKVLRWFEIIAFMYASIGLYEIFTGNYRFVSEGSFDFYQSQSFLVSTTGLRMPISAFANPNDFGLFLLFAFFISVALFYVKDKKYDKVFSLVLIAFYFFLIVCTQSRSIFMSVLGGSLLWVLFSYKSWKKSVKIIFISAIALSISSIITWLIANEELYSALISIGDESDNVRMNLIKYGIVILKDTFFLGTDIGNIEAHMARYAAYTNEVTNIHNWWMEILVSSGVVIFFRYITLYFRQIRVFYRHISRCNDRKVKVISQSFMCFMISFILGSVTSSSIFPTEWMWIAFCVIFAFPEVYKQNKEIV